MNNKIDKLINDTMKYIQFLEYDIKTEELENKYNSMIEIYGEEKAFQALKNTHDNMKNETKVKEKLFWNSVRYEILNKFKGGVPCNNRDLKSMIKNNEINITGLTQEIKIKELLS